MVSPGADGKPRPRRPRAATEWLACEDAAICAWTGVECVRRMSGVTVAAMSRCDGLRSSSRRRIGPYLVTAVLHRRDGDLLAGWVSQPKTVVRSRRRVELGPGGLRFAFYGRTSTSGYQDRVSSRCWQLESARDLIAGHGGSWPSSSRSAAPASSPGRSGRRLLRCSPRL
jgi:hypothetical protein